MSEEQIGMTVTVYRRTFHCWRWFVETPHYDRKTLSTERTVASGLSLFRFTAKCAARAAIRKERRKNAPGFDKREVFNA